MDTNNAGITKQRKKMGYSEILGDHPYAIVHETLSPNRFKSLQHGDHLAVNSIHVHSWMVYHFSVYGVLRRDCSVRLSWCGRKGVQCLNTRLGHSIQQSTCEDYVGAYHL